MPHSQSAWFEEIRAHVPQASDFAEVSSVWPDVSSWRAEVAHDPGLKECLKSWEGYIFEHRLAVVLEQASVDGVLAEARSVTTILQQCPDEWRLPFEVFAQMAPTSIRDYLVYACSCLVQIERKRRTGHAVWIGNLPSGSPEVLSQLMFKWGPRFRRYRPY